MLKTFLWIGAAASLTISGAAMSQDAAKPNDAQIAHIAYTAGQIDVDAGKQALAKSHNPAVRAFAEEMVRDHAAVNDKALALVTKLGVTPEANATSTALSAQAAQKHAELDKLDGAVARRLRASSEFGVQLDSFSDFVTFDLANAIKFTIYRERPSGSPGWTRTGAPSCARRAPGRAPR